MRVYVLLPTFGSHLTIYSDYCKKTFSSTFVLQQLSMFRISCLMSDIILFQRLKYHTQVTVRSTRGKNARGRKISGIEPMPGEDKVSQKFLTALDA